MCTRSLSVAATLRAASSLKGGNESPCAGARSATSAASPPEQLKEIRRRPAVGPPKCSSLSVSTKAEIVGTRATP